MCHLEGTDVQPSPLEGNTVPTCLDSDVATAKARELGQGRPFRTVNPGPLWPCSVHCSQADATQGITFTSCLRSSEGHGTCSRVPCAQVDLRELSKSSGRPSGLLCSSHSRSLPLLQVWGYGSLVPLAQLFPHLRTPFSTLGSACLSPNHPLPGAPSYPS